MNPSGPRRAMWPCRPRAPPFGRRDEALNQRLKCTFYDAYVQMDRNVRASMSRTRGNPPRSFLGLLSVFPQKGQNSGSSAPRNLSLTEIGVRLGRRPRSNHKKSLAPVVTTVTSEESSKSRFARSRPAGAPTPRPSVRTRAHVVYERCLERVSGVGRFSQVP